jgi:hypothetical protein
VTDEAKVARANRKPSDPRACFAQYLHDRFCVNAHPDRRPVPAYPHCAFGYEASWKDMAHQRWLDVAAEVREEVPRG